MLLSHYLRQTSPSPSTRPDSHFGSHLALTSRKILPFFSCGYGSAFCNPFVFRSMNVMGWGVPPSSHSANSPATKYTKCPIYRRRSPFHSTAYKTLPAQPLSFVLDSFSSGDVLCTPSPTSCAPHSVPKMLRSGGIWFKAPPFRSVPLCLRGKPSDHQPSPALPTVTGAIIWGKLKTKNL